MCGNLCVLKIISLFTCSVTITRSRFTWFHVFITNNAVLSRWALPQFTAQSHLFISNRPRRRKRLPHCVPISPSVSLNCDQFISDWEREKQRESPFLVLSSTSKEGKSSSVYTLQRSICNLCSFTSTDTLHLSVGELPKGIGKWTGIASIAMFKFPEEFIVQIFRSLLIRIASYRSFLSWLLCNIILRLTRVLDNKITWFINRLNRIAYRRLR